jgi:predicted Zn-dependent protease
MVITAPPWMAAVVILLSTFDAIRPVPVTTAERERVLATLPAKGEVSQLDAGQRTKLAAVRRVLEPHGREAVYVLTVIDVPQAFVGLHGRAVVLISEPALDLLDAGQLQALVAHEIGHEFFWMEYVRARRDDDRAGLRRLELMCDGIAIVTLMRAGIDPARLTSALERVIRYNRDRVGAALNEDHYPTIAERRTFNRRLVAWLSAAQG